MRQFFTEPIQYTSRKECACKGSGIIKIDSLFVEPWIVLRETWGEALSISSLCRTPAHNLRERGNKNSLHLTENPKWPTVGSMAADITWISWPRTKKLAFAKLAWRLGWSVGLHNSFCHIDRRGDLNAPGLAKNVFLYGTWDFAFDIEDVK